MIQDHITTSNHQKEKSNREKKLTADAETPPNAPLNACRFVAPTRGYKLNPKSRRIWSVMSSWSAAATIETARAKIDIVSPRYILVSSCVTS